MNAKTDLPYSVPDRYVFDGCTIDGVYIHPVAAFECPDAWYEDLINRAIPLMNEKYMLLFIDCSGHAFIFLDIAQKISNCNKE